MARTRSKTVSKDAKPEVVEVDLSDASDMQPEALAGKKRSIEVDANDDEPDNADQLSIPSLVVSNDEDDESDEEESTEDIKKTADSDFDSEAEREDRELEKLLGEEPSDVEFSSDEDSDGQVTYVKGADGKPRSIRPEIIPVYDSDDTDQEDNNTIGNVPLSAYDQFPHIGYDIDGKRIMRPATGSALDALLDSIDLPEGWTGLLDKETGGSLNLTKEELELVKRIQKGENPDDSVNPYEDYVDWFTGELQVTPVTAAPEPKRRFVPSKHEAKRVMKIVRAIREGRIVPNKPKKTEEEEEAENLFDIWADNMPEGTDHVMNLRAPKLPPPTNEESYNPPEEYLPDDKEREAWETADPEDRERNFLPKKYPSLRQVPGYSEGIRERFERSLDLYLAPRVRRAKLNIDPESLIPELPSPKDLRPFPIKCSTIFKGHRGRVRAVSIDPSGQFLATGGDDGTVRVWELLTGRELWRLNVVKGDSHADDEKDLEDSDSDAERDRSEDDHVDSVQWNPNAETGLLAVAAGENVYLLVPPVFDTEIENRGRELIEAGWGYASKETNGKVKSDATELDASKQEDAADDEDDDDDEPYVKKKIVANWTKPGAKLADNGVGVIVRCKKTIKKLSWHRRGDYFLTVSPAAQNTAVLVHQLSKHNSQSPFRKSKGIVQDALFHPFRPHLYVATQRYIRVYDLAAQVLAKKLQPGVRWLSGIDIHPQGDNVLASSYDKRVIWHDLDLSSKPYKTLRYHDKAVRAVRFHKTLPLFVSASDDGLINVFHGSVYDDLMKNPLLVPLKKLQGHSVVNSLGVLDVAWHSKEAWLVSAGADGTARLWTA